MKIINPTAVTFFWDFSLSHKTQSWSKSSKVPTVKLATIFIFDLFNEIKINLITFELRVIPKTCRQMALLYVCKMKTKLCELCWIISQKLCWMVIKYVHFGNYLCQKRIGESILQIQYVQHRNILFYAPCYCITKHVYYIRHLMGFL